jgi:hypothetical protein
VNFEEEDVMQILLKNVPSTFDNIVVVHGKLLSQSFEIDISTLLEKEKIR